MTEKFSRWDAADDLKSEEDIVLYFEIGTEEDPGDGRLIRAAFSAISRARGMAKLAKDNGLYTALSSEGNPSFAPLPNVTRALGLKLHGGAANA